MTVTDRATPLRTRRPSIEPLTIEAAVGKLLARRGPASSVRPLSWTAVPTNPIDAIDLFTAARALGIEAALWLQPATGRSIVGLGRAWAVDVDGPDRFADAAAAWRTILADADGAPAGDVSTSAVGAGPVLLGGLGFTGRLPAGDDPWAPFGAASLVLPTFTVTTDSSGAVLAIALAPSRDEDPDPADVQAAWDNIARAAERATATAEPATRRGALHLREQHPDRAVWERTVGQFAGAVGRGRIDKVVLARRISLESESELDVAAALRHLARTAPESTTFAFERDGTTFLGATPERLVRTRGRAFETVAIAGSAPRGCDAAEDARLAAALLASEKEREEHVVVVDTLRSNLAPIVESLEVGATPGVLPLAHLQHLVTPVTGTTRDEAGLFALGATLHPTPAVGGAPRDVALAMIEEHETFDRGWYAGPIGWLGADGDGELMVALRCGLVDGRRATLFAGCGIVADSDPAREWEESGLKLRTMIAALGGAVEDER
jgi:salicylate biosynthesis isochorismate synthase